VSGFGCRRPPVQWPATCNAAPSATTAGHRFREATRTTENPTIKLLDNGLIAAAEALQELDAKLEKADQQVRSSIVK
jgi:hypothetical protein